MARGEVDVVLVGADRVAANGDTANKVGTYTLAVLAARHGIPFYVCAPTSSVDLDTPDGSAIVIEERTPRRGRGLPRRPHRAARDRGPQPGLRRHAGRADHRHRHRGGRHPRAVRDRPAGRVARRGHRALAAIGAAATIRPRSATPGRPAAGRLMATVAAGPRGTTSSPGRRPTGRSSATSSSATGCTRRTPSATSRSASSAGPAGASPATATSRSRSCSSTTARPPSRCSSMGRPDGIADVLRDLIRPRAAYVAARADVLPADRERTTASTRARRWSGCGSTRRSFRPYPATVQRLLPVEIGDLNRLYQLGFASWLPSTADRRRRLLRPARQRPARRRGRHPRGQPRAPGWRSSATS